MISKNVVREYNIIFDLNIDPWWRAQEFSGRTSPTRGFWGVQKYLPLLEVKRTLSNKNQLGVLLQTLKKSFRFLRYLYSGTCMY